MALAGARSTILSPTLPVPMTDRRAVGRCHILKIGAIQIARRDWILP
ncbi:MAG: hypothetical protein WA840_06855 [Caulobacteraceae bacterium]